MDNKALLRYGIAKRAGAAMGFLEKLFGLGTKAAETGASAAISGAKTALTFGVPGTIAMLAWLAHKATSPKAVADNATEYAINAMEKESLVQSIRDAEDAKIRKRLSGQRKRVHDQFL